MGERDEDERMVLPMVVLLLLKKIIVAPWLWWCYREARKIVRLLSGHAFSHKRSGNNNSSTTSTAASSSSSSWRWWPPPSSSPQPRPVKQRVPSVRDEADGEAVPRLLRSALPFPYFMLVAFEGGGVTRAVILLLAYPFIWLLMKSTTPTGRDDLGLRCMAFITFCGMRIKNVDMVARAVLPKFLMDNLNPRLLEAPLLKEEKGVVVFRSRHRMLLPRVMMERFLKEHLAVDDEVAILDTAPELHTVSGGRFYSGLVSFPPGPPRPAKRKGDKESQGEAYGGRRWDVDANGAVQVDDRRDDSPAAPLHPVIKKPVVFHDGRLALFPTPLAMLAVLLWLPMGIVLGVLRAVLAITLPYNLGLPVIAILGVTLRANNRPRPSPSPPSGTTTTSHALYACTHRTLLDPVALSIALKRPVTAVTYSLSRFSELVSPIRTVRLTRDRARDGHTMRSLLRKGDLAVCPEGTTCREPFLLRFSPLFAEVTDRIVPVAVDTEVGMFYGTTATGRKWLDPLLFLMNPAPRYWLRFLDEVPLEFTCGGTLSSRDVANRIQAQLAEALGFQCTNLTRKDKYMMLAGNQGLVAPTSNSRCENCS